MLGANKEVVVEKQNLFIPNQKGKVGSDKGKDLQVLIIEEIDEKLLLIVGVLDCYEVFSMGIGV